MADKVGNIMQKIGEYTTREGEKKGNYRKIGVVLRDNQGRNTLVLDFQPHFSPDRHGYPRCFLNVFKVDDEDNKRMRNARVEKIKKDKGRNEEPPPF